MTVTAHVVTPSPPQHPQRIQILDGWRGYAILGVLFAHFFFIRGLNLGRFGVEMFFVLSGRLMAEILFERRVELSQFLKKRINRVWPTLFMVVTSLLVLNLAFGVGDVTVRAWASCLTFTYNYLRNGGVHSEWADHIWSLCIEEHMYLLLAVIAFARSRWTFDVRIVLAVLVLIMTLNGVWQTTVLKEGYYQVYWQSDVRGASILIGGLVYLCRSYFQVGPMLWLTVGASSVLLNLNPVPDYIKYTFGTVLLALALVHLDSAPRQIARLLVSPVVLYVGLISYSLYLFQQPLYKVAFKVEADADGMAMRMVLLVGSVLLAIASYKLFETPVRNFLNRVTLRR